MNARDLALTTLDRFSLPNWPAASLASSRPIDGEASARDRELAARIESATIKNLLQINHLISHFADRPIHKIDPRVRKIIGIALAQLLFLNRIPPSAAVDEAVKQARRFGRTSAAGFVNAILRRATREPLPHFPSIDENPREHARLALSHPPELFDRLATLLGEEQALKFCQHNNRRPPTIVRLLPGASPESLRREGIAIIPHESAPPDGEKTSCVLVFSPGAAAPTSQLFVVHPTPHDLLRQWSQEGIAQPQDPTSAGVVEMADVQAGATVLDRCCGVGTKTMQLAERVGKTGRVVAVDRDAVKLQILKSLLMARGIRHVDCVQASSVSQWGQFDRILIDVPCSNSGVLARRSAARYFQDDQTLASLQKLQLEILTDTAERLFPDGRLIYSTCSIWPEENEGIVRQFIDLAPGFELLTQRFTLPSFDTDDLARYHDGGYVAVLRRAPE